MEIAIIIYFIIILFSNLFNESNDFSRNDESQYLNGKIKNDKKEVKCLELQEKIW